MHEKKIKEVLSIIKKGGISRGSAYERFFNKINSKIWIVPLFEEGFFRNPPAVKRTKDSIFFPFWVESRYLARMVPYEGEDADAIIKIIGTWTTDNERVHEDIIDIIMGLPIEKISSLLEKEFTWISEATRLHMLLPYKCGELISYLAKNNLPDHALKIAERILILLPDTRKPPVSDGEFDLWMLEPQTKLESSMYEEIIRKRIPDIFYKKPIETLVLLLNILNNWINLSRRECEPRRFYDYSHIWRPTIENSEHNISIGIDHTLISTIRDLLNEYLSKNPERISEINEILESFDWKIYQRLSMYFLRSYPDRQSIKKYLLNRDLFNDHIVWNEYALLIKERFQDLESSDQNTILQWIDEGPNIDRYKKNMEEFHGRLVTRKKVDEYVNSWKRLKLLPIYKSLSPEIKSKYSQFVDKEERISDEEFVAHKKTSWVGPTSPKSKEELSKLNIDDLIQYLKEWVPSKEHMVPSPEGLGRTLANVVIERVDELSKYATKFINLEPTYIRHVISGFNDALRNKKRIQWEPVIGLCEWIIKQPREILGRDQEKDDWDDFDANWGLTRKGIADLLDTGLSKTECPIPFRYKDRIWRILCELIEDSDPTPEQEVQYESSNWDPFTLSINCVRGEAMHGIIRYGLWCRENLIKDEKEDFHLTQVPELLEKINGHLDKNFDPSYAVHSVYGHWFPWLILLDKNWSITNSSRIFPNSKELIAYWWAAWMGYIMFREPYNEVLPIMHKVYRRAIDYLEKTEGDKATLSIESMNDRLAAHLMTYYWRGILNLSDDGLIKYFFKKASQSLRKNALRFIGRSLKDTPGYIEDKYIDPLKELWEWRFSVAMESENYEQYQDELASFGSWFGSGKFDPDWSFKNIKNTIEFSQKLGNRELVMERIAALAKEYPNDSIQLCEKVIMCGLEPWDISYWQEYLRELFNITINSGEENVRQLTLEIIDSLGALGHYEFRDIWESANR